MADNNKPTSILKQLVFWSEWHALAMSIGLILVVIDAPLPVPAIIGLVSFSVLISNLRNDWTTQREFGLANAITAFRLLGIVLILGLSDLRPTSIISFALALFALDAVDGWCARKLGLVSEFGEYFDKEVDAFFLLALCLMLYANQRIGMWILIPGVLRYLFVLFMKFARPPEIREQQNKRAKWIFFLMLSTLIFCFTPYPLVYQPLTVVISAALSYSFLDAVWRLYRKPSPKRRLGGCE